MLRAALVAAALATTLAAAAPAHADTPWLCRPDLVQNPCEGDQTTRHFAPDGSSTVETPAVPSNRPVDCFYVYPTVSNQPGPNATPTADPEVRSIALYQAQRFSTRCRVYAPLYREATTAAVAAASQTHDTSAYETALTDIRAAWRDYLEHDNLGRGVVLIGHSQGSRMLRALIRRDIDAFPGARDRIVSAIIPGANATTEDFQAIAPCTRAAQTGCVISYHTFNATPPANARFGRTDTDPVGAALGLPAGPDKQVICVDPAELSGDGGRLRSLTPSEPFAPGVIAALMLRLYGGAPPSADTAWLEPADHYTARCERSNGANVLMISPVGDARRLTPSPDDTWGVHLVDLNLPLDNLLTIVGRQTGAWLKAHAPLRAKLTAKRPRVLIARVTGPPGRRVALTLLRGARVIARRQVTLSDAGRARVRFRVRKVGSYRLTAA